MTPAEALGFLRGPTTKQFLFHTVITIGSHTTGPGNFCIYQEPRAQADRHDTFRITEPHPQNGPPPGAFAFTAVSVPMRNRDALAGGIDGLQLPNGGTNDLMVTGMLTSCSFMYSTDKRNMFCAHIQPTLAPQPGVNKGLALGIALRTANAPFTNDPGGVRFLTRGDYENTHHVNLLGVRRGDGWSLYAQGLAPGAANIIFSRQLV